MALTDENMVMPVSPMNGNNGGLFGTGGDSWLGILFLIALLNGGFGGFGGWGGLGNYGAMMGMGMWGMDGLYPWMNNSQNINNGFRDQMLNGTINNIQNSLTSGFGDIQTALCGGFANVNQNISNGTATIQNSLCNGFNGVNNSISSAQNAIAQQMYANQIANLERSYAAQTANSQNMNTLAMNLQNCCCENRANVADLKYTVATENCADRYEAAQNTQSIISALTAGIQSIKDDLCQDRLDAERRENANLRSELMYARGQASQVEQTAQLLANNNAQTALFQQGLNNEVDALYNRLKNCPVNSVPVYGSQPIFTQSNCGCACGSM